jgi:acyl transferase domain-containing protein
LSVRGFTINWQEFFQEGSYQRIVLPTYPFQRQKYWFSNKVSSLSSPSNSKLAEESIDILEQHQSLPSITDLFYETQWEVKSINKEEIDISSGWWLIFSDDQGIGKKLGQQLQGLGYKCVFIYPNLQTQSPFKQDPYTYFLNPKKPEHFQYLLYQVIENEQKYLKGIVHLWTLDAVVLNELTLDVLQEAEVLSCASILHLTQAIAKQGKEKVGRLWIITQGGVSVDNSPVAPTQSTVWGLGKVIALEYPQLWGGLIDLEPQGQIEDISLLVAQILKNQEENQIAIRQRKTHVPRLVQSPYVPKSVALLHSDGTYLITGGLGGLGLKIASWMVKQGARHLVIIGRHTPSFQAKETLEQLEQLGATINILQVDIAERDSLTSVFQAMPDSLRLKGIIHCAGILDDGILQEQTWERLINVHQTTSAACSARHGRKAARMHMHREIPV